MRRAAILALGAGLLASPALAQTPPARFDLVCAGTRQDNALGPKVDYEVRYRIDVEARRWCMHDCPSAAEILQVTPDRITFADEEPSRRGGRTQFHYVSRIDGSLSQFYSGDGLFISVDAMCEPAPFSGFPAAKF